LVIGGSGADLATGAGSAADLTGAAAGAGDTGGVLAGPDTTTSLIGAGNTPVSTPCADLASTGGVLDPGGGTPAGSFGTQGSDSTASTGIGGDYGVTAPPTPADVTPIASSTTATTPVAGDTSTLGSIGNYLKSNAGLLTLGGAGLAANLASPMLAKLGLAGKIPNEGTLTNIAGQAGQAAGNANAYAGTLESPLTTGKLPAGAETEVNNALNDSITQIKSRYANLGLTGSTMEQQAITEAQNQAQGMRFQIAQQMAQTGLQAGSQATADLGLQGKIYQSLTQDQIAQDKALSDAIASFTGAIGGGVGRGAAQAAFSKAA
jgi:hypothetical protein